MIILAEEGAEDEGGEEEEDSKEPKFNKLITPGKIFLI